MLPTCNYALAEELLAAAKKHEESWSEEDCDYTLSVDAAAAGGNSVPVVVMLLTSCWNESLAWAEQTLAMR